MSLEGGLAAWAVGTAGLALATCAQVPPRVVEREVPASCVADAPPDKARWQVVDGPQGAVCLDEAGAGALARELEARRLWDARVWSACRP